MSNYYLACRIGREWYGISIDYVIEVLHIIALRQLPNSDLVGVMTLREKVIPVMDLRQIMGLEEYQYSLDTPIIALKTAEKSLGVIVDEADDVITIANEHIQAHSEALIQGIAREGDRLLFILNTEELVHQFLENKRNVLV